MTTSTELSLSEFVKILDAMSPTEYEKLITENILSRVNEELPKYIFEVLLTCNLTYNNLITECKLSEGCIDYLIKNAIGDFHLSYLIKEQNISFEQIKLILNNPDAHINMIIFMNKFKSNMEVISYIFNNYDDIHALNTIYNINGIRKILFYEQCYTILDDSYSMLFYGFVRPEVSIMQVIRLNPCVEGAERMHRWATYDKKYTWNEMIARHILANKDSASVAKTDITWLANALRKNIFIDDDGECQHEL